MNVRARTLVFRAIRGAWACARAANRTELLRQDQVIRLAMVAAWKAGYRNGREDEKRRAPRGPVL